VNFTFYEAVVCSVKSPDKGITCLGP